MEKQDRREFIKIAGKTLLVTSAISVTGLLSSCGKDDDDDDKYDDGYYNDGYYDDGYYDDGYYDDGYYDDGYYDDGYYDDGYYDDGYWLLTRFSPRSSAHTIHAQSRFPARHR